MSKAPAYALIRFIYYIFQVDNPVVESALNVLGILGVCGILIGSVMAMAQYDFRRMLAYSSVAQIGYIAIGLAMGNMYRLGGLNKKMAISSITVALAALSMIGLPPTCGFFSKWYLMLGAYTGGEYFYIFVLVISSLLNAIYFFRIIEQMFVQREASLTEVHPHKGKLGLPLPMVIPILIMGIMIIALGFGNATIVTDVIKLGLPGVFLR